MEQGMNWTQILRMPPLCTKVKRNKIKEQGSAGGRVRKLGQQVSGQGKSWPRPGSAECLEITEGHRVIWEALPTILPVFKLLFKELTIKTNKQNNENTSKLKETDFLELYQSEMSTVHIVCNTFVSVWIYPHMYICAGGRTQVLVHAKHMLC